MAYVELACRLMTGLTFLSAGISKIRDREGFAQATRMLLPSRVVRHDRAAANAVLAGEFAVACLLAVPAAAVAGYLIATALSVAFAVATAAALRRGVQAPCRCFGNRDEQLSAVHIVRDFVLTAAALVGVAGALVAGPSPRPAGAVVACAAGAIGAVLLIFLDDVVGLFRTEPRAWGSPAKEM